MVSCASAAGTSFMRGSIPPRDRATVPERTLSRRRSAVRSVGVMLATKRSAAEKKRASTMVAVVATVVAACESPAPVAPTTSAPASRPAVEGGAAHADVARIDAAIAKAAAFLVAQQAADGAFRSATYGALKDGRAITPLVAS